MTQESEFITTVGKLTGSEINGIVRRFKSPEETLISQMYKVAEMDCPEDSVGIEKVRESSQIAVSAGISSDLVGERLAAYADFLERSGFDPESVAKNCERLSIPKNDPHGQALRLDAIAYIDNPRTKDRTRTFTRIGQLLAEKQIRELNPEEILFLQLHTNKTANEENG